jgi:uncharacterized Zn-finger protein
LISSLFVSFLLIKIDGIVHGTLYNYGLRFDYEWAQPYWDLLRFAFVGLALPMVLGGIFLLSSFRETNNSETQFSDRRIKNTGAMLVSCSSCKRVFGKPLVLLDFSRARGRLVNVCPYCNAVLGSAEEKDDSTDVVADSQKEVVDGEELDA